MCMTDAGTLTLTGLLQDPLIRMVMRSDGVTEQYFSDLMLRVQDTLLARQPPGGLPRYAGTECSCA